ncbi:hypothetical protein BSKO_10414 [Bryopsis sp. KO-2023]|nr:hypothetical protein BSKO_10414 [Bryopsis sp. KO-2023]
MPFYFVFCLVLIGFGNAREHYRSTIPNGDIVPCPGGDPHCDEGSLCEGVGHESCGGGVITPALNKFGQDLLAEGVTWTKELCEMDSDGDGFSNGEELGDPCCIWTEGARSPQWMLDWPVSHPGVPESKQLPNPDIKKQCENALPLEAAKFYNAGEEQKTLDFHIEKQTIPAQETTYVDYRLNLPEGETYYVVGAEPLLDNKELLNHFTMRSCTTKVEKPGVVPYEIINEECTEGVYFWSHGSESSVLPSKASISLGEGTGRVGLILRMHYNNPFLKEGLTDASGMRLHVTTKPREYEAATFGAGTIWSVGTIPPKTKFLSATLAQFIVDEEIAPDGVTVFAYIPHMHFTGRRMFTERLKMSSDLNSTYPLDLADLEKVDDLTRDDKWSFHLRKYERVKPVKVKNGEILATTCIYDTRNRDDVTVGGPGSTDEMCIIGIGYYPAEALKVKYIKGPGFFGALTSEQFQNLTSLLDFIKTPKIDSSFPEWRRAYLEGDLTCDASALKGIDTSSGPGIAKGFSKSCGKNLAEVIFTRLGDKEDTEECSLECAEAAYNLMGCSLLKNGMKEGKLIYPLYPIIIEIDVEKHCKKAFLELYDSKTEQSTDR